MQYLKKTHCVKQQNADSTTMPKNVLTQTIAFELRNNTCEGKLMSLRRFHSCADRARFKPFVLRHREGQTSNLLKHCYFKVLLDFIPFYAIYFVFFVLSFTCILHHVAYTEQYPKVHCWPILLYNFHLSEQMQLYVDEIQK